MKRLLVILVPLLGFVCTCRYLPFDKDLELTAATISKLKLEATIGPIDISSCFFNNSSFLFMPDKENYNTGFIIKTSNNGYNWNTDFTYIARDVNNNLVPSFAKSIFGVGYSPYKPNGFAETISSNPKYLLYIAYDYTTPPYQNAYYNIIHFDGSQNLASLPSGDQNIISSLSISADSINGAYINPWDNRLYLIYTNTGNFTEINISIDVSLGLIPPYSSTRSASPPNPDSTNPFYDFFYSYDYDSLPGIRKSFISYHQADGFHNNSWSDAILHQFSSPYPPMRILSNHDLISFDKGVMYVLDTNGTQLYRIPMGELGFAYEKKETSGEFTMVFSLATATYPNGDNCNASYTFQIYSCPTNDIAKLNF